MPREALSQLRPDRRPLRSNHAVPGGIAPAPVRKRPLPRLELPRSELPFEPRNEAGVAILFGQLADDLGFKIVDAQAEVPDCTATLKGETVRIELEYSSKGFRREVNSGQSKKVDLVLCWKHDWGSFPVGIPVYELRKIFGLGWKVWLEPMWSEYADRLPRGNKIYAGWSVPSMAGPDDLLLIYRPKNDPDMKGRGEVREVMRVRSSVERVKAGWRKGHDWMGSVQRVATLDEPLTFDELKDAGVRPQLFQGRPDVTESWPWVREQILRSNRSVRDQLAKYGPKRGSAG